MTNNETTNAISDADAQVAQDAFALGNMTQVICETCKTALTDAEIGEQLEHGGEVLPLCDNCANTPSPMDMAKLKAENEALKAKQAKAEADDLAAEYHRLKAENDAIKAKAAKADAKAAAKIAAKTAPTPPKTAPTAPNTDDTPLLATDCRPGVIDPKHLTPGDVFLLDLLKSLREKPKADDGTLVRGSMQRAVFGFFTGKHGCEFTDEHTNSILEDALARNVVSKKFIRTKQGVGMYVWYDAQWRANIKRNWVAIDQGMVTKAKSIFGK